MTRITLTVLVKETYLDRFPQVVEGCRRQGMVIEREMVALGVFSGTVEPEHLSEVGAVEGVASVEPERPVRGL